MKSWRRMQGKVAGLVVVVSMLVGCVPASLEDSLMSAGYQKVGTTDESSIWVAGKPNGDGDYAIKISGKYRGFCNGSVIEAVGVQICNGGELGRGSMYIIGAPEAATGGSLTLTDGTIIPLESFELPGRGDLKIAVGSSSSSIAVGFIDVQFTTIIGAYLDREGNPE